MIYNKMDSIYYTRVAGSDLKPHGRNEALNHLIPLCLIP